MSIAGMNMILNTIVADSLEQMIKELGPVSKEESGKDFGPAIDKLIQKTLKDHKKVIFNGNNYSEEWRTEAEKRGLPNIKTMAEAIPSLTYQKSITVFTGQNVLNETECNARAEINYSIYAKAVNIEAKTMILMASRQYIPAVIRYTTVLADSIRSIRAADNRLDISVQSELLESCSRLLGEANTALHHLQSNLQTALLKEEGKEQAFYFKDEILPVMESLRKPIDELESLVDKDDWPVPTYGEMLYEV